MGLLGPFSTVSFSRRAACGGFGRPRTKPDASSVGGLVPVPLRSLSLAQHGAMPRFAKWLFCGCHVAMGVTMCCF